MEQKRIEELNKQFAKSNPEDVLSYFLKAYKGKIALSSSLSVEDQVLTHMILQTDPSARIFTLDTGRLFPETHEVLESTNRKYGINIEVFVPDAARVEKMVNEKGINLFYNSIEAIDRAASPKREVLVCCKREDGWVHVRICDTGPGFEPKWRETIFDLFETDKANRIGMGLAISRSIIEAHGGKIWAEPEAGEGAVFHFTLPIMQEEMNVE